MLYRSLFAANVNIVLKKLLFASQMYNIDTFLIIREKPAPLFTMPKGITFN
jgi:hypothetical protein